MSDREYLDSGLRSVLAAARGDKGAEAERFASRLLDAFSVAASILGRRVRQPDPEIERDLEGVDAIAAASGLMVTEKQLSGRWWSNLADPIVAGGERDAVAIIPARDSADVVEPITRKKMRIRRSNAGDLPSGAIALVGDLPKVESWSRLVAWSVRNSRWPISGLVAGAMIGGLAALILPLATTAIFSSAVPAGASDRVMWILVAFAVASTGAALVFVARNTMVVQIRDESDSRLSRTLMAHTLRLPANFFRSRSSGDILNRTLAVEEARAQVTDSVPATVIASAFGIVNLFFLIAIDPLLGALVSLATVLVTAVSIRAKLRARTALTRVLRARDEAKSYLLSVLEAITPIRSSAAEARVFRRWAAKQSVTLEELRTRIRTLAHVEALDIATPIFVILVATAGAMLTAARPTAGEFMSLYAALLQLVMAITLFTAAFIQLTEIGPTLKRIEPLTEAVPERALAARSPGRLRGGIEFSNVVFGYAPDQAPLLDEMSLEISEGEFVAVVGPSGSGKSTLLRLMLGFETPWQGVVSFDGQDLADLDVTAVRRQIGTVLQSADPIGRSVRDAICGPRQLDDEDVWGLLEQAGFAADVREMSGGLDAPVGTRGSGISGGQRQRLMIARALAGDPSILLFDEATSALDNLTQSVVVRAILERPVTRVVIAHRLSTISRADRVMVVSGGRIVEHGPPDELLRTDGHFAKLSARQEI